MLSNRAQRNEVVSPVNPNANQPIPPTMLQQHPIPRNSIILEPPENLLVQNISLLAGTQSQVKIILRHSSSYEK